MRVAITGSHGLLGSALAARLASGGHTIVRVVRGQAGPGEVSWEPQSGRLDPAALADTDAVVHLAGVGIAEHRWTDEHKRAITDSRVLGTTLLAETVAAMDHPPALLSASAIGYYGDRGDQDITETSPPGTGFLAECCVAWEHATHPAKAAGVRVVNLRTGIVLTPEGGALKKQLPLFKLGVGGRLGSGRQYVSWISLDDELGAIEFALANDAIRGPLNLTAPLPVTNSEFTKSLGHALHRPTFVPVPTPALKLAMGAQMVDEMLLAGAKVLPEALLAAGYEFRDPTLEAALTRLV